MQFSPPQYLKAAQVLRVKAANAPQAQRAPLLQRANSFLALAKIAHAQKAKPGLSGLSSPKQMLKGQSSFLGPAKPTLAHAKAAIGAASSGPKVPGTKTLPAITGVLKG
jgi:hypothetical protein